MIERGQQVVPLDIACCFRIDDDDFELLQHAGITLDGWTDEGMKFTCPACHQVLLGNLGEVNPLDCRNCWRTRCKECTIRCSFCGDTTPAANAVSSGKSANRIALLTAVPASSATSFGASRAGSAKEPCVLTG